MLENIPRGKLDSVQTIQKTLITTRFFSGFWDRWITHGILEHDVIRLRPLLTSFNQWQTHLEQCSFEWFSKARQLVSSGHRTEAEQAYRLAGLYLNLIQWILPERGPDKCKWYYACVEAVRFADQLSNDIIKEVLLTVGEQKCFGRVRIPDDPKAILIFINPYDSSKEELFSYEQDFARQGFVTFSCDGPGQGETYIRNAFKATRSAWQQYVSKVIDYASHQFPRLPLHLFGTSSGAAWALAGSHHSKVQKVVAVSPACNNGIRLPDYFLERLAFTLEHEEQTILPQYDRSFQKPTFLFHGKQDAMVRDDDMAELFEKLPKGSKYAEYEGEGHCCNYKLEEIRKLTAAWYLADKDAGGL